MDPSKVQISIGTNGEDVEVWLGNNQSGPRGRIYPPDSEPEPQPEPVEPVEAWRAYDFKCEPSVEYIGWAKDHFNAFQFWSPKTANSVMSNPDGRLLLEERPFGCEVFSTTNWTDEDQMAWIKALHDEMPTFTWLAIDVENPRSYARSTEWNAMVKKAYPRLQRITGPIPWGSSDDFDAFCSRMGRGGDDPDWTAGVTYRNTNYRNRHQFDVVHTLAQIRYIEEKLPHLKGKIYMGVQPVDGNTFALAKEETWRAGIEIASYNRGGRVMWSSGRVRDKLPTSPDEVKALMDIWDAAVFRTDREVLPVQRVKGSVEGYRTYETAWCRIAWRAGFVPMLVDDGGHTFYNYPQRTDQYTDDLKKTKDAKWCRLHKEEAVMRWARVDAVEQAMAEALREEVE